MIAVELFGGVGNQLFQYAAARALALRRGVGLAIDTRRRRESANRKYALDAFAIVSEPIEEAELPSTHRSVRQKLWMQSEDRSRFSTFAERQFTFDQSVMALPDWTYLRGYFQSSQYFADQEMALRRELAFVSPIDSQNQRVLGAIGGAVAVSLHVRRGDYVTDAGANRTHGTLGVDYYRRAADLIARRCADPVFFVFSDDLDWVAANLALPYPLSLVRHNGGGRDTDDMRLMTACRHHIVANSSFSWWAAWLSQSRDKTVVAPKIWFRDATIDDSTLIPPDWIKL